MSSKPTDFQTVNDLADREEFALITCDFELLHLFRNIGLCAEEARSFGCAFVEVLDGEYGEIYGCENSVPWLTAYIRKVYTDHDWLGLLPDYVEANEYWATETDRAPGADQLGYTQEERNM